MRGERGRERKRTADKRSERGSVSQKWKWHGLEMAVSGKGHLSIFNNTNQLNQCNQIGCQSSWKDLKFFCFTGAATFGLMTTCFSHYEYNEVL